MAPSWEKGREPHGLHAGKPLHPPNQFVIELIHDGLGCILLSGQRVGGGENMVRAEAEINRTHLVKTSQQQTRSHHEHQSDGDFAHYQR